MRQQQVHFRVEDDGCRFAQSQAAAASERGSFGLQSMEARISTLGGQCQIRSQPGEGTRVTGWLPLQQQ